MYAATCYVCRMTKPRVAPDLVVIVAGVCAALHVGKLPPALPVLHEALGITLVQSGFLLSIVQLAGMSAGVLFGLMADRVGSRRCILIGLWILAAASGAGGFETDASSLMALRGVEGVGFLMAVLPVPALLRSLVDPTHLKAKLGVWAAFMPTGTALALLCGPWVMRFMGWQGWWWTLALLTAAMAIWIRAAVAPDRAHGSEPETSATGTLDRLRTTLTSAGPWLVALTFAMYSCQWMSVIGFLPSIYAQSGLSVPVAGALTALVAAANAAGNVGAGRWLHAGARPQRLLFTGFATMAICAVVAFGFASAPLALRFAAVLLLSGVGGLIPGALFSVAVMFAPGPRTVSTTVGWMQQLSAAGQFAGPPIVAWVASIAGGWQLTWTVTGGASLVGIALAAMIGSVDRRRAAGP